MHISALRGDYYHHDTVHHALIARHSNSAYRLGDAIRVMVARVDMDSRKIDFDVTD